MVVSHSAAKRYALALFDLALEEKIEQIICDNFTELIKTIEDNEVLHHALHAPIVSERSQDKLLSLITKKGKWHDHFKSFLYLLSHNRRLFLVNKIYESFVGLLQNHRGEISARVVSAAKLTKKNKNAIETTICNYFSAQKVTLKEDVDTNLLGGFVVDVQSLRIDTSLRGELRRMENQLKAVNLGKGN